MLEKILFGEKNETTIQKFIKKIKVEIVCKEFKDFNLDLYDEPSNIIMIRKNIYSTF